MKPNLYSLPEAVPGEDIVHVTLMPHFDPIEGRRRFIVPHGRTIGEIVAQALPSVSPSVLARAHVTMAHKISIMPVERRVWGVVKPKAGIHVSIRIVPADPGSLTALVQLLTTVASAGAANGIGTALSLGTFAQSVLNFAFVTAGGLLLNSLFKPETATQSKEKPTFAISGWRNQATPDGYVPLIAGKIRYAPPYAAMTYTEIVGDLVYIRSAFLWGYGPLAIAEDDLKIGETPIDKYDELTIETQQGDEDDVDFTLYPIQVIEESVGAELVKEPPLDDFGDPTEDPPEEKPVTRFTASDAAEACVIFLFEGGLLESEKEGGRSSKVVEVEVAMRLVGAPDFDVVELLHFEEEKAKSFFRAFRWTLKNHGGVPTRGRYEIQLTRKTKNDADVGDQDDVKWFALQSFRPESPFNFSKAHAKTLVRVKGTAQLNSTLDTLNGIVGARIRDWNGSAWLAGQETSSPSSFAVHALTGAHIATPEPDSRIDWPAFEDWHEHCADAGLKYDRAHDFEADLSEVLAACGAAGRAVVWDDGEKWTVIIDRPRTTIDDHISPRNASDFRWSTTYFIPPDAIRVTFLDASNNYQEAERIIPWPADVRYATKALMDADLSHREGTRAEVYADPTPANNGYYRKAGAIGAGSWIIKPFDVTEALELPGKTDPDEIWIETRRLMYERIYRNTVYTATQAGTVRRAGPGSAVMLSRDVLVRAMHSGRVTGVNGKRITIDAKFEMEEGQDYGLRFRAYDDDDDGMGESVLRTLKTVAGTHRAVTLTGEGKVPAIHDLVHFGPIANESIPVIVAGIERGQDDKAILHMLPAADDMHAKVAAEAPPTWSGRVGAEVGGSNAEPPVPIVTAVRSGLAGTGDPDGLYVRLKPASGSAVIVGSFEIQHRLAGAGSWETPIETSASSGVVVIPGYSAGDSVEWHPRSVSINNIPSSWGSTRTTVIGEDDPAAPGALNSSLVVATGGMGKVDIFFTVAPSETNISHVQLYSNTSGTLDTSTDAVLAPVDVDAGGTYTRVHGDPSIATLLTNGDLASATSPPTTGTGWTVGSGKANHGATSGGSLVWSLTLTPGKTYRHGTTIDSISGVGASLTPRLTGGTTVTGTAETTAGRKRGKLVAVSGNNAYGQLANTNAVIQIDDNTFFEETSDCLPQCTNYFWLQPFNGVTPGPIAGPFVVGVD